MEFVSLSIPIRAKIHTRKKRNLFTKPHNKIYYVRRQRNRSLHTRRPSARQLDQKSNVYDVSKPNSIIFVCKSNIYVCTPSPPTPPRAPSTALPPLPKPKVPRYSQPPSPYMQINCTDEYKMRDEGRRS